MYLKGTQEYRLRYVKPDSYKADTPLDCYSDSDWAADKIDRKSTSGFLIFWFGCLLSWGTFKQKLVTVSSTEAEYVALSKATNEIIYVRNIIDSIAIRLVRSILHYDNTGSGFLAVNPTTGPRTKHIDIRFHHIRDFIKQGVIGLVKTDTLYMLADTMTKALPLKRVKIFSFLILNMIGYTLSDLANK